MDHHPGGGHWFAAGLSPNVSFRFIRTSYYFISRVVRHYGSVWNPESTRERKKYNEENDFLLFGSTVENIKEYQNSSKFYMFLKFSSCLNISLSYFSGCEALRLCLEPIKY